MRTLLVAFVVALLSAAPAFARGGHYVVDGATPFQEAQIRQALDVSKFDFDQIPASIRIHVQPGTETQSLKGDIWIGADWFKYVPATWGFIQHEYAHQLDFFVLTAAQRAEATRVLGGNVWSYDGTGAHDSYTAERFASMLAYTFWPEATSVEAPRLDADTRAVLAAGTDARAFQAMLARWGLASGPAPVCRKVLAKKGHYARVNSKRVWIKPVYRKVCV